MVEMPDGMRWNKIIKDKTKIKNIKNKENKKDKECNIIYNYI